MTQQQFDNQQWYKGMKVMYSGEVYDVWGVRFLKQQIQIQRPGTLKMWVNFQGIDLLPETDNTVQ